MKRKRFSVEQIVAVLKQAEMGTPAADLIRQTGITEQTFLSLEEEVIEFNHDGLESDQVRELKQVLDENARLKKQLAELSLDKIRPPGSSGLKSIHWIDFLTASRFKKVSRPALMKQVVALCHGVAWLQRASGLSADTPVYGMGAH